ncbi:HBS1-like protein, partial [Nowakowskiella sp. JEL0078]
MNLDDEMYDYADDEDFYDDDDEAFENDKDDIYSVENLMENIFSIVGDSFPKSQVLDALQKNNYSVEKSISFLLDSSAKPYLNLNTKQTSAYKFKTLRMRTHLRIDKDCVRLITHNRIRIKFSWKKEKINLKSKISSLQSKVPSPVLFHGDNSVFSPPSLSIQPANIFPNISSSNMDTSVNNALNGSFPQTRNLFANDSLYTFPPSLSQTQSRFEQYSLNTLQNNSIPSLSSIASQSTLFGNSSLFSPAVPLSEQSVPLSSLLQTGIPSLNSLTLQNSLNGVDQIGPASQPPSLFTNNSIFSIPSQTQFKSLNVLQSGGIPSLKSFSLPDSSNSSSTFKTALAAINNQQLTSIVQPQRNSIWGDLSSFAPTQTLAIPENCSKPSKAIAEYVKLDSLAMISDSSHNLEKFEPSELATVVCLHSEPPINKTVTDFTDLNLFWISGNASSFKFDIPSPDDVVKFARDASKNKTNTPSVPQAKSTPKTLKPSKTITSGPPKPLVKDLKMSVDFSAQPLVTKIDQIRSDVEGLRLEPDKLVSEPPKTKAKKIDLISEFEKRNSGKVGLNLVVVGHVDAGKSTIMGHLLYLLGEVSDRVMKKHERDSTKAKKSSFQFAWVLDECEEERERGITMDIAITHFETTSRKFTLLDAPGHRDFIPNMISGAAQADVALLVVDATVGEFETGFGVGGQTREHALLVRSLGVLQIVVAVNKMDMAEWSKKRFDEIQGVVSTFLIGAGFKKDKIRFVPCSGFSSVNLIQRGKSVLKWWDGPTLVELLDTFEVPSRPVEKPFRMAVTDYFKGGAGNGGGAATVGGRIESGGLQTGDRVKFVPFGDIGTVKDILLGEDSVNWAVAGDNILITVNGIDFQHL